MATVTIALLGCASEPAPSWGVHARPTLARAGHPLLVSNNPESITSFGALAIFTRIDRAGAPVAGRFRVFLHHLNALGEPAEVCVAAWNPSRTWAVEVSIGKATRFTAANPSPAAGAAGADAFATWLASPPARVPVAWLAPGAVGRLEATATAVPPGAVVSGYFDLEATIAGAAVPAPVAVFVLATPPRSGPPGAGPPGAGPPPPPSGCLPRDATRPTANIRGAFPTCTRLMTAWIDVAAGAQFVQVAAPVTGFYGLPYPGEYETGYDECDGIDVCVNGNYGVDYRVRLALSGTGGGMSGPGRAPLPFAPAARLAAQAPNLYCPVAHFALALEGRVATCATTVPRLWPYAAVELPPGGGPRTVWLWTTVAGGSCAPARHWVLPAPGLGAAVRDGP